MCLSVRAAFWDQDVGSKRHLKTLKTNEIKLKTKLKEVFLLSGNKRQSLQNVPSCNNLIEKQKIFFLSFVWVTEARTSMVELAVSFS
jgi:hypothetical protein